MKYMDYLKTEKFPLFYCSGCGCGVMLGAIVRAFEALDIPPEKIVACTGIGCFGKVDDYMRVNALHGTHGRALAFATGVKLANPELHVFAMMGDGDGVTIGGNHFIHAARRNVDVTALIVNNLNYGMTGGQYSGTTPENKKTSTSRYGHIEQGFDICRLAIASGATYVARETADNSVQLKNRIVEAVRNKGFSLVEIIAPCPTHFGRNNGMASPIDLMNYINNNCIPLSKAKMLKEEELEGKLVTGRLHHAPKEDYGTKYRMIMEKAAQKE